ncbi:GntR family transcriptional regulator [Pokkaliibacter plantistimulans]|uniref:GntR family transcriptional regulator n=1 Tax=Proteobacteria bacterium 228 TaxID=2083153 RepID=A0A2S5KGR8_9PROT|nr:GntR family transcriptional regulator [Pokkaliibacter plantistimulans]PPC73960.1 GntR family transcriptional regulator [Pokkaliibacter plantistimulans]
MKQIERSKSLTEVATDELRRAIVNGSLELGQLLSENALAATLGISRTPVREALSQLRLEGLVKVTPKGSCVFTLSAAELRELCFFRFGLESLAVREAITHNPDKYAAEMAEVVSQMESKKKLEQIQDYLELDRRFHQLSFCHSDNRYLEEAFRMVEGKISAMRTHLAVLHDLTDKTLEDHHAILSAVRSRKAEKVIEILDEHINSIATFYESNIADIAEEDARKSGKLWEA